ncbi:MAG: hypothetical protein ACQET8_13485 [Bacillota bacterium]
MNRIIEKFKSIRIQKTSINFLGMSFELGLADKKKLSTNHLKELYKIRSTLSRFYFLYQHKAEQIIYSGEEDMNSLIIGMHQSAVNVYKDLSNDLLASEYFLLLNHEQRNSILESFDYVTITDTYLEADDDNDVSEEEVAPIVEGLLKLYEDITLIIEDLQQEINSEKNLLI